MVIIPSSGAQSSQKTAGAAFADWAPLDEDNIFEILLEN